MIKLLNNGNGELTIGKLSLIFTPQNDVISKLIRAFLKYHDRGVGFVSFEEADYEIQLRITNDHEIHVHYIAKQTDVLDEYELPLDQTIQELVEELFYDVETNFNEWCIFPSSATTPEEIQKESISIVQCLIDLALKYNLDHLPYVETNFAANLAKLNMIQNVDESACNNSENHFKNISSSKELRNYLGLNKEEFEYYNALYDSAYDAYINNKTGLAKRLKKAFDAYAAPIEEFAPTTEDNPNIISNNTDIADAHKIGYNIGYQEALSKNMEEPYAVAYANNFADGYVKAKNDMIS